MALLSSYELKILWQEIAREIDRKITSRTEKGIKRLKSQSDEFVSEVATSIYRESGHKVVFEIARRILQEKIDLLEKELIEAETLTKLKSTQTEALIEPKLTKDEITERIREIIAESEELEEEEIDPNKCMSKFLGYFEYYELCDAINEEFDVYIFYEFRQICPPSGFFLPDWEKGDWKQKYEEWVERQKSRAIANNDFEPVGTISEVAEYIVRQLKKKK